MGTAILVALGCGAAWLGLKVARDGLYCTIGLATRPTRYTYTHERYGQTKERADAVIGALQRYEAQHGFYPNRLDDLVPAYLPQVERPTVGDGQWQYTAKREQFTLAFFVGPLYEGDFYDSNKGSWYVDR